MRVRKEGHRPWKAHSNQLDVSRSRTENVLSVISLLIHPVRLITGRMKFRFAPDAMQHSIRLRILSVLILKIPATAGH